MDANLALTTGTFHWRPTNEALRSVFAFTWVHRMPDNEAVPIIVTPDASIDLQWIDGVLRLAGPDKEAKLERLPPGATVVGFRFQPAAAAAWLRLPMSDVVGTRVPLEELWGRTAHGLANSGNSQNNVAAVIKSLECALTQFPTSCSAGGDPMRAAYRLIERGPPPGAPLLSWLCRALGMSERTLRRRFDESFGYGPKTLDRILRHRRFLRSLRSAEGQSAASLAAEAGYADQAHLIRESRRLTGRTPLELERLADKLVPETLL